MQINIQISTVGYSERHAFEDPRRPTRSVYPFIFAVCLFCSVNLTTAQLRLLEQARTPARGFISSCFSSPHFPTFLVSLLFPCVSTQERCISGLFHGLDPDVSSVKLSFGTLCCLFLFALKCFKHFKSAGIVVERVWRNLLKVERMISSDVFGVMSGLICSLHSFNCFACCAHWGHEVGTLWHLPGNEELIKDALRKNYRFLSYWR